MGAVKEYYHDLIESRQRLHELYNLKQMNTLQLLEIAATLRLTVGDCVDNETLIREILIKQNENL